MEAAAQQSLQTALNQYFRQYVLHGPELSPEYRQRLLNLHNSQQLQLSDYLQLFGRYALDYQYNLLNIHTDPALQQRFELNNHFWGLLSHLAATNLGPEQLTTSFGTSTARVYSVRIPGDPPCWAAILKTHPVAPGSERPAAYPPMELLGYDRRHMENGNDYSMSTEVDWPCGDPTTRYLLRVKYTKQVGDGNRVAMHALMRTWTGNQEYQSDADSGITASTAARATKNAGAGSSAAAAALARSIAAAAAPTSAGRAHAGAGSSAAAAAEAASATAGSSTGAAIPSAVPHGFNKTMKFGKKNNKKELWIDRDCWLLCGLGDLPEGLAGAPAEEGAEAQPPSAQQPMQPQPVVVPPQCTGGDQHQTPTEQQQQQQGNTTDALGAAPGSGTSNAVPTVAASVLTGTVPGSALAAAAALPLPGGPGSARDASTQTDIDMQSPIWRLFDCTVQSGQAPGTARAANAGPLQGNQEQSGSQSRSGAEVLRNTAAAAAADGAAARSPTARVDATHRQPRLDTNQAARPAEFMSHGEPNISAAEAARRFARQVTYQEVADAHAAFDDTEADAWEAGLDNEPLEQEQALRFGQQTEQQQHEHEETSPAPRPDSFAAGPSNRAGRQQTGRAATAADFRFGSETPSEPPPPTAAGEASPAEPAYGETAEDADTHKAYHVRRHEDVTHSMAAIFGRLHSKPAVQAQLSTMSTSSSLASSSMTTYTTQQGSMKPDRTKMPSQASDTFRRRHETSIQEDYNSSASQQSCDSPVSPTMLGQSHWQGGRMLWFVVIAMFTLNIGVVLMLLALLSRR